MSKRRKECGFQWLVSLREARDPHTGDHRVIAIFADRVELTPSGALVFWDERWKDEKKPAYIRVALAAGTWNSFEITDALTGFGDGWEFASGDGRVV